MNYEPRPYQDYITNQILENKKIYPVADMGLGKTVATLTAINDLLFNSFSVNRVLIIAPLRVAKFTWPEEIKKWNHLSYIRYSVCVGSAEARIKALNESADIYIINRENVEWLVSLCLTEIKKWPFDMLVIDEASSFKSTKAERFKSLKKVSSLFDRVVLLSGTPTPNSKLELWPQIYLMDRGERLLPSVTAFRRTFFTPGRSKGNIVFNWILKPNADVEIDKRVSDVMFSLKSDDHIKLPERIDNFIEVEMDEEPMRVYKKFERECYMDLSGSEITAVNAAVLENKLLQLANGAIYPSTLDGRNENFVKVHNAKIEALEEIVEANEGNPILVFYSFRHDKERIKEHFKLLDPIELETEQNKLDWDNGKIKMLIAHPSSIGHGLNLQTGGHIIVWFGLTNSLELYQQANKRLHRPGQKETVLIHHLVCKGTEDENVVQRLKSKGLNMDSFIESIKAKIDNYKKGA